MERARVVGLPPAPLCPQVRTTVGRRPPSGDPIIAGVAALRHVRASHCESQSVAESRPP